MISMDAFLQNLTETIFANISKEHFGAEELAKEVGISRSQIHRKLTRINGKSITRYMREIRLEEALKLLNDNAGTAAEVAHRVGFNSPTYFNKCFHEYFGYPPGTVKKKNEMIIELNKSYLLDRFATEIRNLRNGTFSSRRVNDYKDISETEARKFVKVKRSSAILYLMLGLLILIIFLIIGTYFI